MQGVDLLPVYGLLGILVLGVGLPRAFEALRTTGRLMAYACLIMVVGLFLAQGLDHSRATFPFVSWTMYSAASFPFDVWDVAAVTIHGDTISPLLPLRGMSTRGFFTHIYSRASVLQSPAMEYHDQAEAELVELFDSLSRLHAARGGAWFHSVVLTRCPVQDALSLGTPGSTCDRRTAITLALPGGAP